jgi:SWI/SNF-related matrix-associated actin-dependent regulator of chromatin subfamily A3
MTVTSSCTRWNPSSEDQAIDRVHRLGQTRDVEVYRLICTDTVEERLLQLQDTKRALSQRAIGRDPQAGGAEAKLSLEELRAFFV